MESRIYGAIFNDFGVAKPACARISYLLHANWWRVDESYLRDCVNTATRKKKLSAKISLSVTVEICRQPQMAAVVRWSMRGAELSGRNLSLKWRIISLLRDSSSNQHSAVIARISYGGCFKYGSRWGTCATKKM